MGVTLAQGQGAVLGVLMPYEVYQYVCSAETYSICVRTVNKISVYTIYQWNTYSSGFLRMYFITTSLMLGFLEKFAKI